METASEGRESAAAGPVLLFDGLCNLCDMTVRWVIRNDKSQVFRFAALESDVAKDLLVRADAAGTGLDSVVLLQGSRIFTRSTAALEVLRLLGPPWSWSGILRAIPRPIRDALYDALARRRYRWFGHREVCALPTPELRDRFLDDPPPRA